MFDGAPPRVKSAHGPCDDVNVGRSALPDPRRPAVRLAASLAIVAALVGATSANGDRHAPRATAQAAGHHGAGEDPHGADNPDGADKADGGGPPGHDGSGGGPPGHDGSGDATHGHGHGHDDRGPQPAKTTSPPVTSAQTPPPPPQPTASTTPTTAPPPPTPTSPPPMPTVVNSTRTAAGHRRARQSTPTGVGSALSQALGAPRKSRRARAAAARGRFAAAPAARAPKRARRPASTSRPRSAAQPPVLRSIARIIRVVPTAIKAIIAALAFLAVFAAAAYYLVARTARYLKRQRETLLGEIGVLQAALLPEVPDAIGGLRPSVAYRPAEGLGAGGDFYDAFALDAGRVGLIVGDISGHGRGALMRTSLLRHTLRAYLDAGVEPRAALQIGGKVLDRGFDDLATVILATYDPSTQSLRYASAGHPPPIFVGEAGHEPVTAASSPPLGAGVPTGLRQTTVGLAGGATVCLFTDGLIEARRDGEMVGRPGLARMLADLGEAPSAKRLIDELARQVDRVFDDMAACVFSVEGRASVPAHRIEELEVRSADLADGTAGRFMLACGLSSGAAAAAVASAADLLRRYDAALVRVAIEDGLPRATVAPANVESLAVATLRELAG
jgi:hypothetical protein